MSEIKNNIVLKIKKPSSDNEKSERVFNNDIINELKETLIVALKIISISCLVDDEQSEDFLSNYSNYDKISYFVTKYKLSDGKIPVKEDEFLKNPIESWMNLISIIFVSLYFLPEHSNVYCDNIGEEIINGDKKINQIGIYFSTVLTFEAYDWKEHKIDFFLANDSEKFKNMFLIDDEPVLYQI